MAWVRGDVGPKPVSGGFFRQPQDVVLRHVVPEFRWLSFLRVGGEFGKAYIHNQAARLKNSYNILLRISLFKSFITYFIYCYQGPKFKLLLNSILMQGGSRQERLPKTHKPNQTKTHTTQLQVLSSLIHVAGRVRYLRKCLVESLAQVGTILCS
jgi:hypothetical protein